MFKNLKLRTKITLLVVFAAFIPMLVSGLSVTKSNIDMQDAATEESIKLATTDLDHIAEGVEVQVREEPAVAVTNHLEETLQEGRVRPLQAACCRKST